jgi:hypothetical protein
MKVFLSQQRIVVSSPFPEHAKLKDAPGVVRRPPLRDDSAWVDIVSGLPEDLRRFHDADDWRRNYIRLWPGECEERK